MRIIIALTLGLVCIEPLFGKDNYSNGYGLSITDNRGVRFLAPLSSDISMHVDFYYSKTLSDSNNVDYNYLSTTLGVRKYSHRIENLQHFFDFDFSIGWVEIEDSSYEETGKKYEIYYGLEYILSDKFSIEGRFGIGIFQDTMEPNTSANIEIPKNNLAINYRF